ncbi:MAG TPA: hypothetical protein VLJ86_03820 [Ramlibacter sp.]|nr:hypothetical protein [Ramlibacter sp.]
MTGLLSLGLGCLALLACPVSAWSDTGTSTGLGNPAGASLRFGINIDKFLYLRIGTDGGSISTVSFNLTPSIPATPTTPTNGNNQAVNWNAVAPSFTVTPSGNVLPVEVRSNGGTVTLRAATTTALTSGSNTIPMSRITIASSDNALPAPPLADSGSGTSTSVTGTAFGNLVTLRSANWTFTYAPTPAQTPMAGTYTGQVTFTASVP